MTYMLTCVRYTTVGNQSELASQTVICATLLEWPSSNSVMLGALAGAHVSTIEMVGLEGKGLPSNVFSNEGSSQVCS